MYQSLKTLPINLMLFFFIDLSKAYDTVELQLLNCWKECSTRPYPESTSFNYFFKFMISLKYVYFITLICMMMTLSFTSPTMIYHKSKFFTVWLWLGLNLLSYCTEQEVLPPWFLVNNTTVHTPWICIFILIFELFKYHHKKNVWL